MADEMEREHDETNEEESDSSSDEGMEQDKDPSADAEIHQLELQLETNPYNYQSHIQLINLLSSSGDLERLRQARENMSKSFPLTEELWLSWIEDELPLACIPDHRETIKSLFDRGVQDYQSVKLWIQYCQFMMDNMETDQGLESVRATFEKALTSAGLHVTEGSSIWDGFREFETTILDSFEQMLTDENQEAMEEKIAAQRERVESIYRRQLAVPLLGMQMTMRDFEDWLEEDEEVPVPVKLAYQKAETKLEEILPYEDELNSNKSNSLEAYKNYLKYEVQKGEPVRIVCLYERALKDNCLYSDLWMEYTTYLDSKLKISSVVLPAHERAVRNCPWVASLWQNYMLALERSNQPSSKIKEIFDKALTCGFSSGVEFLQLWRCYCNHMRRRVKEWTEESHEVKEWRDSLKSAIEYMQHYFGNEGDSTNLLDRCWARLEAYKLSNLSEAQRLWEIVISRHGRELEYWVEYANLVRTCKDVQSCRKVLHRAVQSVSDNPEGATRALLSLEEEEGSLEDWDSSYARCATRLKIVNERRTRAAEKEMSQMKEGEELAEKKKASRAEKKATKKQEKKAGKKDKAQIMKRKAGMEGSQNQQIDKVRSSEPAAKKPCVEGESVEDAAQEQPPSERQTEEEELPKHLDRSSDPRKVFISNLLFSITEDHLRDKFSKLGEVLDVRIVKNMAGRSKGYAYVEFNNESTVQAALAMDREKMEGRPMFISPCVDKAKNPTTFKFPTSLDKHTLFVSNLPFDAKESEIEELFSKHGVVKQVRLVTNRAGKPKGYGYVEYEQESSASTAVLTLDKTEVKGRTISVALSNPPTRRGPPRQEHPPPPPPGSRGRAKTQLQLIPRSLQKTSSTPHTSSSTSSPDPQGRAPASKGESQEKSAGSKGFSNEYFRSLMQKK
ncbi:squamous cell carcinoma antigen recognized by T-cells 3 [Nematostella vectensis]|uniref:squamous cell carcinoma antigen recognized by T-cells 3 n=1 Tax=Nematostella vectensis TaxID=45351 RepID=UPI0020774E7D|nr:squamous cell carcinoma antigen recognized by T-cells 3 [Nematostella vectensis]